MKYKPREITGIDLAFGTMEMELLPKWTDIPESFRDMNDESKYSKLVSDWFFGGLESLSGVPKEGIDPQLAFKNIKAILRSFDPKHEHKQAGCAFLLSEWFEDVKWEKKK